MSVLEYLSLLLSLCHCYFVFVTVDLSLLLCHCRFVALSLLFYCYRFLLPLLRRHLVTIPMSLSFCHCVLSLCFGTVALSLSLCHCYLVVVVFSMSWYHCRFSFCHCRFVPVALSLSLCHCLFVPVTLFLSLLLLMSGFPCQCWRPLVWLL